MARKYIALIHKDPDSAYGVSFPDLPGCISAGDTVDEARANAVEALALHLEGLAEDRDAIPEPSSLEAIMSDRENREGVAILVDAPKPASVSVRINVTMPDDLLEKIDAKAAMRGLSRSGFFQVAARRELDADVA